MATALRETIDTGFDAEIFAKEYDVVQNLSDKIRSFIGVEKNDPRQRSARTQYLQIFIDDYNRGDQLAPKGRFSDTDKALVTNISDLALNIHDKVQQALEDCPDSAAQLNGVQATRDVLQLALDAANQQLTRTKTATAVRGA